MQMSLLFVPGRNDMKVDLSELASEMHFLRYVSDEHE